MAGAVPVAADDFLNGVSGISAPERRRRGIRRVAIGLTFTAAFGMWATRGLNEWEVESRVADAVRAHGYTTDGLARAIEREFSDTRPEYSSEAGAPYNPVSASGISAAPLVRRLDDDTVRVTVEYAEADVIPTGWGAQYCVVVDVPTRGPSHRTIVEPEYHRVDPCARAHLEVEPLK